MNELHIDEWISKIIIPAFTQMLQSIVDRKSLYLDETDKLIPAMSSVVSNTVIDISGNPVLHIHLNCEKRNHEERLAQFISFAKESQVKCMAIGIGHWGLEALKNLMISRIKFFMASGDHLTEVFKCYNLALNDDLSMDSDTFIRYQQLSAEERLELGIDLIAGVENVITTAIDVVASRNL